MNTNENGSDRFPEGTLIRLASPLNWVKAATHRVVGFTAKRVRIISLATGVRSTVSPNSVRVVEL